MGCLDNLITNAQLVVSMYALSLKEENQAQNMHQPLSEDRG